MGEENEKKMTKVKGTERGNGRDGFREDGDSKYCFV